MDVIVYSGMLIEIMITTEASEAFLAIHTKERFSLQGECD